MSNLTQKEQENRSIFAKVILFFLCYFHSLYIACTVGILMFLWNWYCLWLRCSNEWLMSTVNRYQRVNLELEGSLQETDGVKIHNRFLPFPKMPSTFRVKLIFKYSSDTANYFYICKKKKKRRQSQKLGVSHHSYWNNVNQWSAR